MFHGSFESLSFPKKGSEIIERAKANHARNVDRISSKKEELKDLCDKYKLDVVALVTEVEEYITSNTAMVPSGEVAKLRVVGQQVSAAQSENKRLTLIINNLPAGTEFNLTFDELQYFKF